MGRWLRSPITLFALTIALVGWLFTWSLVPFYEYHAMGTRGMPLFRLIGYLNSSGQYGYLSLDVGELGPRVAVARVDGELQILDDPGYGESRLLTVTPTEASFVYARRNEPQGFGLMVPVLVHQTHSYGSYEFWPNIPELDEMEAIAAARSSGKLPTKSHWKINPRFALHDAGLLFTLLLWLCALGSIPRWKLWRRLTPAQRRRARGCCPRCNYNLKGLTTPTCPECGQALPAINPATN
ncbi:MAG: hypothetical protein KDA31_11820 [Phycisphaerales bacterium]|nr:hypothetical protein [Phycisphaerales bacterium]MCB9835800.1 hypothetical protein [Phycisphaera sp.]